MLFGRRPIAEMTEALSYLKQQFGTPMRLIQGRVDIDERLMVGTRTRSWFGLRSAHENDVAGAMNDGVNQFAPPLDPGCMGEDEKRLQDVLFRLCGAACIYARAFPQYVKQGFPRGMAERKASHPSSLPIILGCPDTKQGGAKSLHLRKGHFRSLMDDRFHRDENGDIRVVFVRDSIIGGHIEPTTVLDPDAELE